MLKRFYDLFKDERGATISTELLIMVAISACIGVVVVNTILPHLKDMHLRAENSITEVTGSGY